MGEATSRWNQVTYAHRHLATQPPGDEETRLREQRGQGWTKPASSPGHTNRDHVKRQKPLAFPREGGRGCPRAEWTPGAYTSGCQQGPRPCPQMTAAWALPSDSPLHSPPSPRGRTTPGERCQGPALVRRSRPHRTAGGRTCGLGYELGLGAEGSGPQGRSGQGRHARNPVLVALPAAEAPEAERTGQASRGA